MKFGTIAVFAGIFLVVLAFVTPCLVPTPRPLPTIDRGSLTMSIVSTADAMVTVPNETTGLGRDRVSIAPEQRIAELETEVKIVLKTIELLMASIEILHRRIELLERR